MFTLDFSVGEPTQEQCAAQNAENVVLTDTLPPGVSFVSETRGDGVFNPATNTVTWNLGTLDKCDTFGNQFQMTVDVDSSIPDGNILTNTLSITTTTPETRTDDNTRSVDFQVGFLPLEVTVDPGDFFCEASAEGGTPDSKESEDGTAVSCTSEGSGKAFAATDAVSLSPHDPGNPLMAHINGPQDVITVRGVGVQGSANGFSFSGGHGSASAEATVDVDINIFNPNPYDVGLRLIRDASLYAAAGNEAANPPFPGDAFVEDTGGTAEAGSGVGTFRIDQHVDASPTECRIHRVEESTNFPSVSGTDSALDPQEEGSFDETDETFPASSCFRGSVVPANSTMTRRLVFGSSDATGDTSSTDTDGDGIPDLFRSGYGLFSASASFQIMRSDRSPSGGARVLVITGASPIDLLVTDPSGKRLGFDLDNKQVVDEIFGGQYTGHGMEPQTARVLGPSAGNYSVDILGIGDGPFTVTVQTLDADGNEISSLQVTGEASQGSQESVQVNLSSDGSLKAPMACDANGDGSVNFQDALAVLRFLLKGVPLPGNGDCNNDGQVNFRDVIAIIKAIRAS